MLKLTLSQEGNLTIIRKSGNISFSRRHLLCEVHHQFYRT